MRMGFQLFLTGIFRTYVDHVEYAEWSIFLDAGVRPKPGVPGCGQNRVRLPVRHGRVDLTPVLTADCTPNEDVVSDCILHVPAHERSELPIARLLVLFDRAPKAAWLLDQFILQSVNMVEGDILAAAGESEVDEEPESPGGSAAVPDGLLLGTDERHRQRARVRAAYKGRATRSTNFDPMLCILKVFFWLRCCFRFENNQCFHYACDASCVGMKDRLLGIISAAGRPAVWLPPQVAVYVQPSLGNHLRTTVGLLPTVVRRCPCLQFFDGNLIKK